MGLRNCFNQKTKNTENPNTTEPIPTELSDKTKKPANPNTTTTEPIPTELSDKTIKPANPDTTTTEPIPTEFSATEKELEKVFKRFDLNGDGKISPTELGAIMESLGHPLTRAELESIGVMDLKEFIELNTKGLDSREVLEDLKDAFNVFDVDGNGLITAEELKEAMGSLGNECSIEECRKMIAAIDQDGDGVISFEEFKVMMMVNGSR